MGTMARRAARLAVVAGGLSGAYLILSELARSGSGGITQSVVKVEPLPQIEAGPKLSPVHQVHSSSEGDEEVHLFI